MTERQSARRAWLLAAILAGGACRSIPVAPANDDASAVGIAVQIRAPIGFPTYSADTVYFQRRCPEARECDRQLHASNHATRGRLYWLNALPGDYVAVAASFTVLGHPTLYVTYFPDELVRQTSVRISEGSFAYAGTYVLGTRIGICPAHADQTQVETARSLGMSLPGCGLVDMFFGMLAAGTTTYSYRGEIEIARHADADRAEFLERAQVDLAASGWRVTAR